MLFLVLSVLTGIGVCETSMTAPEFTINMDLPANQRWEKPCKLYKNITQEIYQNFVNLLPADMVTALEDIMLKWYIQNAYEPYRSEIEYFAKCSDLPVGAMVTVNLVYDLTAMCTSIVAEDGNGNIIHGRNLDYGGMPLLRNSTFVGNFVNNNGDVLYRGTSFFGYAGLWTGIKPGYFSVSGDERFNSSLVDNILGIHDDFYPPSWLMRDAVSQDTSFDEAKERLISTKVMAPVYFILGGKQYPDGCVITRNSTYSYQLFDLKTSYLNWYVLETNYDWWMPPPKKDDRRDPAIQAMNAVGQNNINQDTLFNVLSTPPVLNDGTLYTTIFSAANQSMYYTMIRFP